MYATYTDGTTFPAHLSPIFSLHQGPLIEAVARRNFKQPPFPDMLWTAIGWLQSGSTIMDVDFLTAMTALEAIVTHLTPEAQSSITRKADFAPLRDDLLAVVAACALSEEAKEVLTAKIRQLNSHNLARKIEG